MHMYFICYLKTYFIELLITEILFTVYPKEQRSQNKNETMNTPLTIVYRSGSIKEMEL